MGLTELFTFMFWPIVATLVLPGMLVYYGLHIVRRGIIFVDLALAQVAALGTAAAIVAGFDTHDWQAYAFSLGFTLIGALIFTISRDTDERAPQEALIGVVYVVAAAAALLLLSHTAEGDEELKRSLIGEVLVVHRGEVLKAIGLFAIIGLIHYRFRAQLMRVTFEPDSARQSGVYIRRWDFLFYALFGLVVTSFVHIGGVLMIFTYLIVPAVCANLLVSSFLHRFFLGWGLAMAASMFGLYGSFKMDLPTGAAIVCSLGLLLVIVLAVTRSLKVRRG